MRDELFETIGRNIPKWENETFKRKSERKSKTNKREGRENERNKKQLIKINWLRGSGWEGKRRERCCDPSPISFSNESVNQWFCGGGGGNCARFAGGEGLPQGGGGCSAAVPRRTPSVPLLISAIDCHLFCAQLLIPPGADDSVSRLCLSGVKAAAGVTFVGLFLSPRGILALPWAVHVRFVVMLLLKKVNGCRPIR